MPDKLDILLDEVRALRDEVARLRRRRLVPVAELADRLGVTTKTVKRRMAEAGIPVRDMHGAPKDTGSRATPYVAMGEWETRGRLHTQSVQRGALSD